MTFICFLLLSKHGWWQFKITYAVHRIFLLDSAVFDTSMGNYDPQDCGEQ